jgi:hypothetical protein
MPNHRWLIIGGALLGGALIYGAITAGCYMLSWGIPGSGNLKDPF